MDGARLILNARYFHIAQTGEKATKYAFVAEAAAGLVNYIATRESVIYNYDEHYKEVSATEAQREAINQFLEVSPDLELSREFKAYDEDRSAANASALISRAAQYVYGMTAEGDVKPSAPATRAQRERIQEFVNKVPAIRQTPEYSDYKASPTRENASEVLSHALEVGLANAADPETLEIMLNYIAERPGVVHNEGKVHGLFTVNGAADLAAEKEAIAAHTGNIYSMVFSLRREDADRLGYDRQDAWSQLFAIKADKIAQALRVPTSKLHWVAAVHNTKQLFKKAVLFKPYFLMTLQRSMYISLPKLSILNGLMIRILLSKPVFLRIKRLYGSHVCSIYQTSLLRNSMPRFILTPKHSTGATDFWNSRN